MDPTKNREVWITGSSVIVGGAVGVETVWSYVKADAAIPVTRLDDGTLQNLTNLGRSDWKVLGRTQRLAVATVEMAWQSAGLPPSRRPLRGEHGNIHRNGAWGVVGGSSVGGLAEMELEMADGFHKAPTSWSPYAVTRWRGNACSAAVALRFGLGGPDFSLNAASATGAQIAYLAGHLISAGLAEMVVAVASDIELPPHLLAAMESNGSIAPVGSASGPPLSASRNGMHPSEGAACLIFESSHHAQLRGAASQAQWLGGRCANECHHFVAPAPDGETVRSCTMELLECCGINADSIDWVMLHATGTRRFDAIEMETVRAIFGDRPWPWLTAAKRSTGHVMGASGLVDAALLVEGIRRNEVPEWPKEIDPALRVPDKPSTPPAPRRALQLSQGMGGSVVINLWGMVPTR